MGPSACANQVTVTTGRTRKIAAVETARRLVATGPDDRHARRAARWVQGSDDAALIVHVGGPTAAVTLPGQCL